MVQPSIQVLDAVGTPQTIKTINPNGQDTAANSQPVVLASDQTLPLPTGAATSALQTTGNTALGSIDTKLTSQATAAKQPALAVSGSPSLDVISTQFPDYRPSGGNITAQDVASANTAGANGSNLVTGTPTANSALVFPINGRAAVAIALTGTWTGTVAFEESFDGGTTWASGGVHTIGTVVRTGTATLNGLFTAHCAGATHYRIRATAAMTGTLTVTVCFTSGASSVRVAGPVSIADNVSLASLTIKPASTAPATTDTTAVVGVADGNDVTQGLKADTAATDSTSSWTVVSLLKGIWAKLNAPTLPSGASTSALQTTGNGSLTTIATNTTPGASGILASASSKSVVIASDDVNIGPCVIVAGSTVAGVNQDIIAAMSVLQYRGAYFQYTNAGTGCTTTFQGSNDNSNWFSVCAQDVGVPTASPPVPTVTGTKIVYIPLGFAFLRIRTTIYGSGSPTGTLVLSPVALSTPFSFASQIAVGPVTTIGPTGFSHGTNTAAAVINTNVKASACNLNMVNLSNANATTKFYFKFFNKASAATLGTDTPVWTVTLMPGQTISLDVGPFSQRFSNGLTVAATAAYADLDSSTIATAGDVSFNIGYN